MDFLSPGQMKSPGLKIIIKGIQILLLMFFVWFEPCAMVWGEKLTKVSFIPHWIPQAQFAGYYVAHEKGFYRKHFLSVDILQGGPERPPSELLEKGQADFGTMFLSSGIVKRANGVKLLGIAQTGQRSALMLIAKKSSGIKTPKDVQGKKVGLWGDDFRIQPQSFFQRYNLVVRIIPQSTTPNLFLRGGVDVASAMWYNEYHMLLAAGLNADELTVFSLSDHGLNFPEDGIYCMEETFNKHPQLCRHFVQASLEGWQYAFAHPEEALDIVMKYVTKANVATNRMHQKWMLECMKDLILPPGTDSPFGSLPNGTDIVFGSLQSETYYQVAKELEKYGLIDNIPNFYNFFINLVGDAKKQNPGS